jgi:hypothetical protein
MSGHVIVSGTDTVSGTDGWASVTVDCPPGMVVTGGGANIAIGGGHSIWYRAIQDPGFVSI